jgi:hypothetical protein
VGSGASDKIVYVHALHRANGNVADAIQAFPFGSKGEPLTRFGAGTPPVFTSRSTGTTPPAPWYLVPDPNGLTNRNEQLKQRVYAKYKDPTTGQIYSVELRFDLTGASYADTAYTYQYGAPNQPVRITLKNTINFGPVTVNSDSGDVTIYADYVLDWSTVFSTKVKARSTMLGPPDIAGVQSRLGGTPALSTDDLIYYTADTTQLAAQNKGGRGVLFGVAEQGTSRSALKWAFTMHDGIQLRLDDGSTFQVPPRLRFVKQDAAFGAGPLWPAGGPVGAFLYNVQFVGTPAVRNGVVYATATASLSNAPGAAPDFSVICAFRANPEIRLSLGPGLDRTAQPQIRQVNPVMQQAFGNQAPLSLATGNYTVDYASGIVRITSMAFGGGTNGFLSTSIPFQVKIGAAPERLVYGTQVDAPGQTRMIGPDGVDNLMWFTVLPPVIGDPVTGAPVGLVSTSPSIHGDIIFLGARAASGLRIVRDIPPSLGSVCSPREHQSGAAGRGA